MDYKHIGVLGATSFTGSILLPLLTNAGWHVAAYSRRNFEQSIEGVVWQQISSLQKSPFSKAEGKIFYWICVAPIWVLSDYFRLLEEYGARRIVALSSTSRYTKDNSSDPQERAIACQLIDAEERFQTWAESKNIEWVILRPTLIYGLGRDKNISEIANFIRRFGFFPLFRGAEGLRQPVHVEDVASACLSSMISPDVRNRAYNLSGAETISYREIVSRVFVSLGRNPLFFKIPLKVFHLAVFCICRLPRYRHWSAAMAERMNKDMVFDHADAVKDFGYCPRKFVISGDNTFSRQP